MPYPMQPARIPSGGVFDVLGAVYPDAQTFIRGAVMVPEAGNTGKYEEAGADPALIAGVALQGVDTAPGFAMANNPSPITGRQQKISMAIANTQTIFEATLTNGSATRVAPAQTDVGQQYGITAYSGVWTVDKAKTGASARVIVLGFSTINNRQLVFFKFLPANILGS